VSPTSKTPPPNKRLGSYEVLQEVGQGGMGVICLARQPALDRLVVLKKMRREMAADPAMAERFQREARAAAKVQHQNVVAVHDCFAVRGDCYIAQEFVDGVDLLAVLGEVGRVPPRIAARVALEMARGLEEIHSCGIVHRDLKPANIMLGSRGETKIADFGVALEPKGEGLTTPGTMLGSLPYMSPEQMRGERVDQRSDLFSFGVCLYEMLTGSPPYQDPPYNSTDTLLHRIQRGQLHPGKGRVPGAPRYLDRLIRSCLQPKPARRIGSATAVRRLLERRLGQLSSIDCRREIAAFLWEQRILDADVDQTELRPAVRSRSAGGLRRALPWLLPATMSIALLVSIVTLALGHRRPDDAPVPEPANGANAAPPALAGTLPLLNSIDPVASDSAQPPAGLATHLAPTANLSARLRVTAHPWAEVRIDGGESFPTPVARPLAVAPGEHRIVFLHPTYGRVEYSVDARPGEVRLVRHDFLDAQLP